MWFAAKCLLLVSQWLSKCEGTGSFHNFSDHFVLLVAFNDILVFERMTFYGSFFVVGKLNIKIVHENGKSYTSFSNCAFVFQRHCAYGCTARRKEHVWSILAKHKDYRTISWLNFNSKICFYVHSYKWGKTFNLTECHIWNSCYSEDTCRSTHWRSFIQMAHFSCKHRWIFVEASLAFCHTLFFICYISKSWVVSVVMHQWWTKSSCCLLPSWIWSEGLSYRECKRSETLMLRNVSSEKIY